jgi:hypothetical protein
MTTQAEFLPKWKGFIECLLFLNEADQEQICINLLETLLFQEEHLELSKLPFIANLTLDAYDAGILTIKEVEFDIQELAYLVFDESLELKDIPPELIKRYEELKDYLSEGTLQNLENIFATHEFT